MGFVNENMTTEEKADFKAKNIPNPGNIVMTLKPCQWTINREENIFLIWAMKDHEEPIWYYFLLIWKGINIPVELSRFRDSDSLITWKLKSFEIPRDLLEKKDEIVKSLKEALKVYAINGEPYGKFNKPIEVQFDF